MYACTCTFTYMYICILLDLVCCIGTQVAVFAVASLSQNLQAFSHRLPADAKACAEF